MSCFPFSPHSFSAFVTLSTFTWIMSTQRQRYRGGRGGLGPPTFQIGGVSAPPIFLLVVQRNTIIISFPGIGPHWATLHWATLGYTGLHWAALGYTGLHCTGLHWATLHWATLHWATLPLVWSAALPRKRIVVSPRPHKTKHT